jgi:hypothetical protein
MPETLHGEVAKLAAAKGLSFNQLVQQGLEDLLSHAARCRLREGFEQLANDGEDVEFAFFAQAEALNH